MPKQKDKLTPKQELFVREYLKDLCATQAAIRAGYSKRTAREIGRENLTKPVIARRVQAAMDRRAERLDISSDRVLQEIARLSFSDVRKIFTDADQLKPVTALDDDTAAAVQSVKVVTRGGPPNPDGTRDIEYVHEIKLAEKNAALEKLMKHLGEYAADNKQRSPFASLPRDVQRQILDHLNGIARD